eukprot:TRINITY_DN8791_c0_g1_i1.p1 TRINITY_DN8791_c0_g1~~TRINITY_DN8791_c0_g1_i1.p1  ORF type:complete len:270 (-),score=52.37 TRINITY_DN8791_c0_g1_i1:467-1276(-)
MEITIWKVGVVYVSVPFTLPFLFPSSPLSLKEIRKFKAIAIAGIAASFVVTLIWLHLVLKLMPFMSHKSLPMLGVAFTDICSSQMPVYQMLRKSDFALSFLTSTILLKYFLFLSPLVTMVMSTCGLVHFLHGFYRSLEIPSIHHHYLHSPNHVLHEHPVYHPFQSTPILRWIFGNSGEFTVLSFTNGNQLVDKLLQLALRTQLHSLLSNHFQLSWKCTDSLLDDIPLRSEYPHLFIHGGGYEPRCSTKQQFLVSSSLAISSHIVIIFSR